MENVYIGRQPIVDTQNKIFAYELLYSDGNQESEIDSSRFASASVISNVLNRFGTKALLGGRMAFVKIDEKFLMSDIIFSIPNNFFIFSLSENIPMKERVVERIEQLYDKKYTLSVDDIFLDTEKIKKYEPVLKQLSYVKIIFDSDKKSEDMKRRIALLQAQNIKIVATEIENQKEYVLALNLGCDLFQGYFFAAPNILENTKNDASQMHVLKLYNLLMQDTNIDEITAEFERNHALTVQLLQFINSAAFHFRGKISSIHHVLTLVGRQPLAKWLMLMIYSKSVSKAGIYSPLMLMVKSRTELMENFLKAIDLNAKSNALGEAYFVGVLSLVDTIFGAKLSDILDQMYISDAIKSALLEDKGVLGELYVLVRDIEAFNLAAIEAFSVKHKLSHAKLYGIITESIENVNNFENERL